MLGSQTEKVLSFANCRITAIRLNFHFVAWFPYSWYKAYLTLKIPLNVDLDSRGRGPTVGQCDPVTGSDWHQSWFQTYYWIGKNVSVLYVVQHVASYRERCIDPQPFSQLGCGCNGWIAEQVLFFAAIGHSRSQSPPIQSRPNLVYFFVIQHGWYHFNCLV